MQRHWLTVSLGAVILATLVGGAVAWRQVGSRDEARTHAALAGSSALPARRETRPTLDPALFVGKAATAHRVARAIPDTLDQLYCYCECDKHVGHKSLLSCYTDGHAAT